jgi:bifunctional DNA primase/polymerase-like protein
MDSTFLEAALSYARRNWHMLPVQPGGKVPLAALAPHGLRDATTDAETIRRWWDADNIGIQTGAVSGLVVLDVDPRHDGTVPSGS